MHTLAAFIMRGQLQALLVTVVTAALSLVLRPFSVMSGGAVGLVTLRNGPRAGLLLILVATALVGLMTLVAAGSMYPAAAFAAVTWLPVWVLGTVLRRTISMAAAIQAAGLLGMAVVVGFYAVIDDPAAWWRNSLSAAFAAAQGQAGEQAGQLGALLTPVSAMLTGAMAAALTLNVLFSLFIARWWQAMLYNPGGFRGEMHGLRLGRVPALVTLVLLALAAAAGSAGGSMFTDLLVVAGTLFALQGLLLAHALIALRELHAAWLVGLYAVMLLWMPQVAVLLIVAGLVDVWVDFRTRLAKPKAQA